METKRINKILWLIMPVFFLAQAAGAIVFEESRENAENIAAGVPAISQNNTEIRVNGRNIALKRYESRVPVKKVLEALLANAEKNGGVAVNNPYIWFAANALFKGASAGGDPESFGYVFTRDKKGGAVFTVAGATAGKTEIIKADIESCAAGAGYDDGLSHFSGAKRELSVEFISGGRTLNFGNFYSLPAAAREEIIGFYVDEFKRKGYKILNSGQPDKKDVYILKGKNREVTVSFSFGEKEDVVFVMG